MFVKENPERRKKELWGWGREGQIENLGKSNPQVNSLNISE